MVVHIVACIPILYTFNVPLCIITSSPIRDWVICLVVEEGWDSDWTRWSTLRGAGLWPEVDGLE